ncbi:MAG: putative exported protein [Rubritepida sp.]|nr:putative exported protein [Rubritepida sp.]
MNLDLPRRALLAVALTAPSLARAQTWPSGPIRLVVASAPGSQPDLMARLVADPLGVALGTSVVVDNRVGQGGTIGMENVIRSRADGQTLLMGALNHAINQSLFRPATFDWLVELEAVAPVYNTPNVIVVNKEVPANSLAELVALARARPGQLNFASAGSGTSLHLAGELLNQIEGIELVHVPYRSSGGAAQDLEAGRVQIMFDNFAPAIARVEGGRVRALAVMSAARVPRLPDVPSVAELGYPQLEMLVWGGIFAHARTPVAILDRLHDEIVRIIATPNVRARLDQLGSLPIATDRAAFRALTVAETERWSRVVIASGAKPE